MPPASSNAALRSTVGYPCKKQNSPQKIVWVRREFALGVFLLTLVVGATILSFRPPLYTASASFKIERQKAEIPVLQNNIEQIATSDTFLWTLIETYQLDQRAALTPETTYLSKWRESWAPHKAGPNEQPEHALKSFIADVIRKHLVITLMPEGIILVEYSAPTSGLASKVANAVMMEIIRSEKLSARKKVLKNARPPEFFSEPNISRWLTVTGLLGAILGICLAYLLGYIQIRKTGSGVCTAI